MMMTKLHLCVVVVVVVCEVEEEEREKNRRSYKEKKIDSRMDELING